VSTGLKATYHHKDLRNALVDEVIAMLDQQSQADLTLRELARRLGVTHTAPYAHFADKKALLIAVAEAGFTRLADALDAARAAEADPAKQFEAMGLAYVRFARTHANLYRLMFADAELANDPECELSAEGARAFQALLEALVAIHPPAQADVRDVAVAIWSMVHGVAMLEIDRRIDLKTLSNAEDIVLLGSRFFMRGLLADDNSA
jgi:AcrR family transcriptional regulator